MKKFSGSSSAGFFAREGAEGSPAQETQCLAVQARFPSPLAEHPTARITDGESETSARVDRARSANYWEGV